MVSNIAQALIDYSLCFGSTHHNHISRHIISHFTLLFGLLDSICFVYVDDLLVHSPDLPYGILMPRNLFSDNPDIPPQDVSDEITSDSGPLRPLRRSKRALNSVGEGFKHVFGVLSDSDRVQIQSRE